MKGMRAPPGCEKLSVTRAITTTTAAAAEATAARAMRVSASCARGGEGSPRSADPAARKR